MMDLPTPGERPAGRTSSLASARAFTTGHRMRSVTLVDGSSVASDSEAFKHETLARHVLNLPTLLKRRAWLDDFRKLHGDAETERLQATMWALYDHAQEARSARGATTPPPGSGSRAVGSSGGVAGAQT